jgi:hypothetical protein
MSPTRIFVSFDREHDLDLSELLDAHSHRSGATFEIMKNRCRKASHPGWSADARTEIRAADEVLVICGENTHESLRVSLELAIAQDEVKPYMLLWGRREKMCTKPVGARRLDAMYSWTREILEGQISTTLRNAEPLVVPENCKRIQQRPSSESATCEGRVG